MHTRRHECPDHHLCGKPNERETPDKKKHRKVWRIKRFKLPLPYGAHPVCAPVQRFGAVPYRQIEALCSFLQGENVRNFQSLQNF